jgi:hypothetical protein
MTVKTRFLIGMIILLSVFLIGSCAKTPPPAPVGDMDVKLEKLQEAITDLEDDIAAANNTATFALVLSIIVLIALLLLLLPKLKGLVTMFTPGQKSSTKSTGDSEYERPKRKRADSETKSEAMDRSEASDDPKPKQAKTSQARPATKQKDASSSTKKKTTARKSQSSSTRTRKSDEE